MKRLIALFVVALLVPILASAQSVRITPARVGQLVSSLPATCAVGDVVFLTTAPVGLHECKTLNTWTATGGGGGGNPFDQDLNTTDSPTFDDLTVTDDLTFGSTTSVITMPVPVTLENFKIFTFDNDNGDGESAIYLGADSPNDISSLIVGAKFTSSTVLSGARIAATRVSATETMVEFQPWDEGGSGTGSIYMGAGIGKAVVMVEDTGATKTVELRAGTGAAIGGHIRLDDSQAYALLIDTGNIDAKTGLIVGWDVDGDAPVTFVTITNANVPSLVIAPPAGGTVNVTTTLFTSNGTGLSVANVGANSCGTTAATIAGGSNSFEITVGATAGTQCRVTFPTAAPNRWNCTANNTTTANLARVTPVDTTHVDFLGTFVAGDVVSGVCIPR